MAAKKRPADKGHLLHMRFRFPKGCKDAEGSPLTSLVVREVDTFDGDDAQKAAAFNKTDIATEMLSAGIVALNDEPLAGPACTDGWNMKAKAWAMECFRKVNDPGTDEIEELSEGEAWDPTGKKTTAPAGSRDS